MRLLKIMLLSIATMVMVATSASALVTVDATADTAGPLIVGDFFQVQITATYDGADALTAIFASHQWDSTQLLLTDAFLSVAPALETRPSIFPGGSFGPPALTRNGTIADGVAGDDLSSQARTVQYSTGGTALGALNAAVGVEVTTLQFQVIGVGDGIANIDGFINTGDAGAVGTSFAFGSNVAISIIPEPGTVVLMGLGLMGLAGAGSRRTV